MINQLTLELLIGVCITLLVCFLLLKELKLDKSFFKRQDLRNKLFFIPQDEEDEA